MSVRDASHVRVHRAQDVTRPRDLAQRQPIGAAGIIVISLMLTSVACDESPRGQRSRDSATPTPDGGPGRDAAADATGQSLCSPTTCAGCCSGPICVAGTAQDRCGRGGQACAPCDAPLSCVGGVCQAGTLEACNDIDDDGDGNTDEGCDDDRDGYCDASMTVAGTPSSCASGGGDCDDNRPSVYPGATEICNALDDDCDDAVDEGDVCANAGQIGTRPAHLPVVLSEQSCAPDSSTGKVYCFGGWTQLITAVPDVVELDPASNVVRALTTVLPDARSMLSCVEQTQSHLIYCLGGYWQQSVCTRSESWGCVEVDITEHYLDQIVAFDPRAGSLVTRGARLPTPLRDHACAEDPATHLVYCFGGVRGDLTLTDTIVRYDTSADAVTARAGRLPSPRQALSCVSSATAARIFCFGGDDGTNYLDEIVSYDPAEDRATTLSVRLPEPVRGTACAEDPTSGNIYCLGGLAKRGTPPFVFDTSVDTIVRLDPRGPTLTTLDVVLPRAREATSCVGLAATSTIFCLGGEDAFTKLDDIVELRP